MAVGGYAAARWSSSVAAGAIILGLPAIGVAIVLGRSPQADPETAEAKLLG